MPKKRPGFTLIELIVVVAVIGVLAAILLPGLARSRESARRASCLSNLSQCGLIFHLYASENEGLLPWSGGKNNAECLLKITGDYITTPKILRCPSSSKRDLQEENKLSSYLVFTNADLNASESCRKDYDYFGAYTKTPIIMPPPDQPIPKIPILWDLFMNNPNYFNHVPGGSNVLWLDGSVEFIKQNTWTNKEKTAGLPYFPEGIDFDEPTQFIDKKKNPSP